ncbi:MAG: c-type cytochrome [Lentisphaeraceae bacterium]|nr:c-type cytochrome [Lentisphaeraceae bacterium]
MEEEKDDKKVMGHEYDGIQELDNDLPGWWITLFWITIIFGVIYLAYFHIISPESTQDAEFQAEMKKAALEQEARIAAAGGGLKIDFPQEVLDRAEKGKQTFATFCVACHGNLGQGTQCPNLTDNHFLHGFDYDKIAGIITNGSPKNPAMMAWKTSLTAEQIQNVAAYVFTLRGKNIPGKPAEGTEYKSEEIANAAAPKFDATASSAPAKPMTPEEKAKSSYATCAACHGANGEGNPATKAPALAGQDAIYLARQIKNLKHGKRVSTEPLAAGMLPMLALLKDEDIDGLVKHIQTLPAPKIVHTEKGDATKGQPLYAICATCHGFKGEGNPVLKGPKLTSLPDWYIVSQLKAFKEGKRGADAAKEPEGALMAPMAKMLMDEQAMKDVAEYIKGLGK